MPHIVIVDDHADIRRLLSITLGRQYDIIEAETGFDALLAIRKYRPVAVLLDVMMPGEHDGLQVLEAIRADADLQGTLVAMLTARGQQADRDDAHARGADAYFVKPFSPLQVVSWLREHLE